MSLACAFCRVWKPEQLIGPPIASGALFLGPPHELQPGAFRAFCLTPLPSLFLDGFIVKSKVNRLALWPSTLAAIGV